ncbi:MAG: hypothetical protein ACHQQR_04325 [Gemmatimonadales bacterium]|jgi:hypothetical protein
MSRRSLSLIGCAGLALVSGCSALTDTSTGGTPVGIMVMNARSKGAGFTTSPTVNFYSATSITFSSANAATDSCVVFPYSAAAPSGSTAKVIGGGAYVLVSVSGNSDSLVKAMTVDATYQSSHVSGIAFTPGDSITLTIPGDIAGFPPASVTAKTAEPFTLNPIVVPPSGQPMTVTWSTGNDANGAMLVSLRYNDGTGTGLNAQIFCDFHDDGSGTVQATNIAKWAASGQREVLVQRLRTFLVQVPSAVIAYVNVVSTFDLPLPVSP